VLLPSLDFCYGQLLAAAGVAPYPAAREALLISCSQFILGVLRCDAYAGRASSGAGGASSQDQVRWQTHAVLRLWQSAAVCCHADGRWQLLPDAAPAICHHQALLPLAFQKRETGAVCC